MSEITKIEWTDATWNPWHGCHKVSAGCKNCYMFRDKARYGQDPNTVVLSKTKFYDPLKWKEPRKIFTCSWSDFFIEEADEWRDEAFAIMALTPQHTYQVLTKRPERMLEYLNDPRIKQNLYDSIHYGDHDQLERRSHELYTNIQYRNEWPLKNLWLGVSVEDQKTADERIPLLLQTPAAKRFLSMEPLLGPVTLTQQTLEFTESGSPLWPPPIQPDYIALPHKSWPDDFSYWAAKENGINWVIVGGESGPDARPMHPDWVRSIRDQCNAANVPFFFKQWGEWGRGKDVVQNSFAQALGVEGSVFPVNNFVTFKNGMDEQMVKVGKKKAGRILDGRTWDEMPEVSNAR